jgi:tetratricopeptide (TPR) repeat protein
MWLVALAPRASAEPQNDAAVAPARPNRASETQPSGPPASAPDSSETDRQVEAARAHFFRGVEYYEAGDYRSALLEFRRAFEISRNYRILYNLGRVNHELNQYADAIEAYETYLSTGRDEVEEERRAEVERDLESLRSRTALLTITVNVREAEVLVDNRVVGKSPLPKATRLDAGEHFITVRLDGYIQEERRIVVASGDTVKERLDLSEQRRAALPTASAKPDHLRASPPEPSSSASVLTTVAWIGTGTLAAAAGVTGVLAWVEADKLAELRDTPGSSPDERSKLQSRGKLLATTSDVLTAAAVVAGGTALYLTLSSSDDSPTKDSGVATLGLRGSQLVFTYSH